jgi:predicted amidohydrolase YtcJ
MRKPIRLASLLAISAFLFASPLSAASLELHADTILYNGKIITVDKDFSIAEAVAIKDGKFVAVGKRKEVMPFAGKATKRIDLKGKSVIPGLNDSHNHMLTTGTGLRLVQLRDSKTLADVLGAIGSKAKSLKPGEWIETSGGWHESQLKEKRLPTLKELDSVAPDNPVYVARGGHTVVVNSKAFELAGITKETPDPKGGEFKRDPSTGELTGLLFETPAQEMIRKVMPRLTYKDKLEGLKTIVKEYNRYGITSVTEPIVIPASDEMKAYVELWQKGDLTVRTGLMISARKPEDVKSCQFYQGFGDPLLKISGIKMLMDGGVETAWMRDPYQIVPGEQEKPDFRGVQVFPSQAFKETCLIAARNGWHVETHGVGDKAIETIVDTYEEVDREVPIKDLRWTVMHIFIPTRESIDKMKKVGIWATVQDHPTYLGANQLKYWGEKRAAYAIPIRKLIDEGIPLGGGTDSSVVHYDPFLSLWWMVTRNTVTAGTLGPDQKITRQEAIKLYTIGSAYFTFDEKIKGSIEPGKLADLVILDKDILTCPENDIKNIRPVVTMLGGKFVYEAK